MEGITGKTDTSKRIFPPEHPYLENTIPSMEAAFRMGADVVEFDIHPTTDGQFAVFHDWILDFRTEGQGVTRDYPLDYLQRLDVGYGYTADGGKTYPFRGKGTGMMPSLAEVLNRFPDKAFLIHIKSDDPEEGRLLARFLESFPATRLPLLTVYGGDRPVAVLKSEMPRLRTMSLGTLKRSLLSYIAVGWTGYVPESCRSTQVHIPESAAPWIWGWPNRFLQRMEAADTRVVLVAGSGRFSEGFDSEEDFTRIPKGYSGGIWTNRIDRIGPLLGR
jgi:glycerophosphoryl diester phosphodiesterase